MKLDGYEFTATGEHPETQDAFARFVVHNRHIGFGRMLTIVTDLWRQQVAPKAAVPKKRRGKR